MAVLAAGIAALPAGAYLLAAQPAQAASLVQVTNFGNNPSNLQMYIYVPDSVTAGSVTAANASYDAAISPGGSVSFGFHGTWVSNDTAPTSFRLKGTACT
jgi:hypothetical protein